MSTISIDNSSLREGHRLRLKQRLLHTKLGDFTDYELLELILGLAIPRKDVKMLAKSLILQFRSLGGVLSAEPEILNKIIGIGPGVIATFRIFRETIAQVTKEQIIEKIDLGTSAKLVKHLRGIIGYSPVAQGLTLFLDNKLSLIAEELQDYGTINSISLYPREIVKKVIHYSANNIVLVHNHPSGGTKPSRADLELTEIAIRALNAIDVKLLDHIIISPTSHYSFKEHNII